MYHYFRKPKISVIEILFMAELLSPENRFDHITLAGVLDQ